LDRTETPFSAAILVSKDWLSVGFHVFPCWVVWLKIDGGFYHQQVVRIIEDIKCGNHGKNKQHGDFKVLTKVTSG